MPTILLVEDNPDDIELTVSTLKQHGVAADIAVAEDGVEALEYLSSHDVPDLLVVDLKLPRMNGLELLQRMRADPRTRVVPVVVLTSSIEEEDVARCYEAGANSYVRKPVNYDEFVGVARKLGDYWLNVNHVSGGLR